jgi:hypothetical protein
MATLLSLSAELKLDVIEHLDTPFNNTFCSISRDLLSLSQVCKVFRSLSIPYLFKNITLFNEDKSGSSILRILDSDHAQHVRTLHYVGVMVMPGLDEVGDNKYTSGPGSDLLQPVGEVLSDLTKLPNLERVIVQFAWTKYPSTDEEMHQDDYNLTEELQGLETDIEFRSLMLQSYEALGRNPPSCIKSLELSNVLAHKCSAWNTTEVQELLNELSSFSISIRGGDNGAGGNINTTPGYFEFISELDSDFFEHLKNVTHFRFAATDDGPPAIQADTGISAVRLRETHIPQLRRLELESVFISQSLSAFITAHGDTLESLQLNHCYSGSGWNTGRNISWADFFISIASDRMMSLKVFDVATSHSELMRPGPLKSFHPKVAPRFQTLRDRYPGRRMFDYMYVGADHGRVYDDMKKILYRFENGGDHEAWEQVCKRVRENV